MPPIQAWTKAAPGLGSTIKAFTNAYNPPSTPVDPNLAWQEVNKQLNANVNFTVTAPGRLPGQNGHPHGRRRSTRCHALPWRSERHAQRGRRHDQSAAFLQSKCADLTQFLAGDAIKDYPYPGRDSDLRLEELGLGRQRPSVHAAHPALRTRAQRSSRTPPYYDQEIGANYVPKDADDLKRVYQQLNRPQENRWATAAYQNTGLHILFYAALWGAPNNWAYDASGGKLTKNFESPEFKAAVGYARDLYASGLYHPSSLNYADINAARLDFVGGRFALYPEGFGQPWQDFWRRGLKNSPAYNFIPLPPFAAQQGGKPTHFLGPGFLSTNAFKKGSEERIKELLRVFDFLAAPFGSQEDLLLQYGIKDVHYTLDDDGKLTLNDRSNQDANYVNWKYMIQHPQVMYVPDIPGYAKAEYDAEHALIPAGISDPTLGYYSATLGRSGAVINRAMMDGITDIIAGRRPLEDYDGLVRDWTANGGDQIRKELLDAMAQNG